jgi:adenylate cyclase
MTATRGRILVVDDARINRTLLETHITEAGHDVVTAADGAQALELLARDSFDVVFLDLLMPGVSGFDVLFAMKKDDRLEHVPVIVVSAVEDTGSIARCIEMGALDYIEKPFNPVLLQARLLAALAQKRLRNAEERHLAELRREQRRTEDVLFNVLPRAVAERLKRGEREVVQSVDSATVLFADLANFTAFAAESDPREVLLTLNTIFSAFDALLERSPAEKIKTIGDEYMVAHGVISPEPDHALVVARVALEMLDELARLSGSLPVPMSMRIGIHSGPLVAGVIGTRKLAFDLWGDTVNTAHRIQSTGELNQVVVSETTQRLLGRAFRTQSRGPTPLRGRSALETFVIERR